MAGYRVEPEKKKKTKPEKKSFLEGFLGIDPVKVKDALNKRTERQKQLIKKVRGK